MRTALVLRSLVSGIAVYVLAAACGASERAADVADHGGGVGATFDAIAEGVAEGVVHPVAEASAEPLLTCTSSMSPNALGLPPLPETRDVRMPCMSPVLS